MDRQGFASTGLTAGPGSCGSVLAPLLFLFVIDDLQDHLPEGVHSSLFADDSALWVHTPRKEDAVPVLQEGLKEVYRWAQAKKLTLNLKKLSAVLCSSLQFSAVLCSSLQFSEDPHEAKWQPVVEVEGTRLRFNPAPLFLGVGQGKSKLTDKKGSQPNQRESGVDGVVWY
jgi:hypothetical protein